MRVLSLQPYFGGSHQQFYEGWVQHSTHLWTTLTLPPRHWKWRMRHAAIHFSQQVKTLSTDGGRWDAVFCTDMMNVAEFRGLAPSVADLPIVNYFHENQFVYPNRHDQERDKHFPFTNFVSALVADHIWFNSSFNRDSMLESLRDQSSHWPDFIPTDAIESIFDKTTIQHPGINIPDLDWSAIEQTRLHRIKNGEPLHLIWAARWEHDKNPTGLLGALRKLGRENVPFRLTVIGEQFRNSPEEFEAIRSEFSDVIERWGFQPDRDLYWQALCGADVFISTAHHEFFGLAAAEAIATGAYPLLPNRLAYPELLKVGATSVESCLYGETSEDLANAIKRLHSNREQLSSHPMAQKFRNRLSWTTRAALLDEAITAISRPNV